MTLDPKLDALCRAARLLLSADLAGDEAAAMRTRADLLTEIAGRLRATADETVPVRPVPVAVVRRRTVVRSASGERLAALHAQRAALHGADE